MADQLEGALLELGREVQFPPTPDVSASVRRRLTDRPRSERHWSPWSRALVPLAALLVAGLLVTGVLALWPTARDAIAERLGLHGVQVTQVRGLPTAIATPNLGQAITLEDAQRRVSYPIQLPAALGAPDVVYFVDSPVGGQVVLAYEPNGDRPRLLLFEFEGSRAGLGKGLPPGTSVEEVSVNGNRGLWINGDPHVVFFMDRQGRPQSETTRLAANVLLWENNRLTLRLEGQLARDQAVEIAASTH
jgi:hypothetical protein